MPRGSHIIRKTRKRLGLSQLQLAVRADLAVRTVQFAEGGKEQVTVGTIQKIAAALKLTTEESLCDDEALQRDPFDVLPWSHSGFIQRKVLPGPESICDSEAKAAWVIGEMRENWKVHLESSQSNTEADFFSAADDLLTRSSVDYRDRYLQIWRRLPTSIQLAIDGDTVYGATVVLPVTDEAFARLENGEISFMDICDDDIVDQSQNLVLDSVVEFMGTGNPAWHKINAQLSYLVLCQIALHAESPAADDFRMVSFGASPLNLKRLLTSGFRVNGNVMPTYEYPICSFQITDKIDDSEFASSSTTAHFANLVRSLSLSSVASEGRKRVITHTLALLKTLMRSSRQPVTLSGSLQADAASNQAWS